MGAIAYGLSILFLAVVIGVTHLVRTTRRNEKRKKRWLVDIETGRPCNYHFVSGNADNHEMWVSKVGDDGEIEITFKAQTRFMYPRQDCKHEDTTLVAKGPDHAIMYCYDCGKEWVEKF